MISDLYKLVDELSPKVLPCSAAIFKRSRTVDGEHCPSTDESSAAESEAKADEEVAIDDDNACRICLDNLAANCLSGTTQLTCTAGRIVRVGPRKWILDTGSAIHVLPRRWVKGKLSKSMKTIESVEISTVNGVVKSDKGIDVEIPSLKQDVDFRVMDASPPLLSLG